MLRSLGLALAISLAASSAAAETIELEPIRDATLIESAEGEWANGSGTALFAGRTSQARDARRRALVEFDVASAVPTGAWIVRAELVLQLTPSNPLPAEVQLHRATAPWSEGPSVAGGGGGAASLPGDATWLHSSYPDGFWSSPGGDFEREPSASRLVSEAGSYRWASTLRVVEDVQTWLDEPSDNFGWIVIGDEGSPTTSKRFASREETDDPSLRPRLVIEFESSCEEAGLSRAGLGLCRAYCEALTCWRDRPDRGNACHALARSFDRESGGLPMPCEPEAGSRID